MLPFETSSIGNVRHEPESARSILLVALAHYSVEQIRSNKCIYVKEEKRKVLKHEKALTWKRERWVQAEYSMEQNE